MSAQKPATGVYELITYKVATRMADEGYPVDYEVRCPDGVVLCFANEGGGGPDYLKATKVGRKFVAATHEDGKREDALARWCYAQPANVKYREDYVRDCGEPREPFSVDRAGEGDIAIWVEELGNELQVQKTIARKIKRTVCYRMPGSPDLGYYTVKRGATMSDEVRRRLAAKILGEHPEASVYGSGWGKCANCEEERPEVTGNVVICKACVDTNGEAK